MKRTAHFLVGLGLALVFANAQAVTAVAFSNSTSSPGASFDAPTKEAAMAGAVENCKKNGGGDDCQVFKVTEERGFGAVYMACATGCGVTAVTGRPSQLQARLDGRQDCERHYKTRCKLAVEWEERGFRDPNRVAIAPPPPPKPVVESKPDSYYRAFGAIKGFKDCAQCPEMVKIPAGSFDMGRAARDGEKSDQHRVTVPAFAMGRTEVTVAQWAAFARETGAIEQQTGCRAPLHSEGKSQAEGWRNPGYPQTDAHPVSCVDWEDAQKYVTWLSKKFDKPYRLPSEAEWEYAARAGTTTPFPWGDDPLQACSHANVPDLTVPGMNGRWNSTPFKCNDGQRYPAAVASYLPNAFGLYDMIGNLEEWTADCWHPTYTGAPVDGSAWATPGCSDHPTRGGSWYFYGNVSRRASKTGDTYSLMMNRRPLYESREVTLGFRVALTTDPVVVDQWRKKRIDDLRPTGPPTDAQREFGEELRHRYHIECLNSPGYSDACSKRYE